MKLQPELKHRQLHLSLLDQPPIQLPEGQDEELAVALMELLLQAAVSGKTNDGESLAVVYCG